MSYPHDFAFPSQATQYQPVANGLSKREYAAIHLTVAALTADSNLTIEQRISIAIKATDQLLAAL